MVKSRFARNKGPACSPELRCSFANAHALSVMTDTTRMVSTKGRAEYLGRVRNLGALAKALVEVLMVQAMLRREQMPTK